MYSVGSFLELMTAAVAWRLYGELWKLMVHTGLAYLPFVVIVLMNLRSARESGGDRPGLAALRMSETRLYVGFLVALLAAMPVVVVPQRELIYAEQSCTGSRDDMRRRIERQRVGDDGWMDEVSLDGDRGVRLPLWWWLVNNLGQGISAVAINALPCAIDVRRLSVDVMAAVEDPLLRAETRRFHRECWTPAYRRFLRDARVESAAMPASRRPLHLDVRWAGSRYFLDQPDYYAQLNPRRAVKAFPYSAERDAIFAADHADGGWPNCRDWWSDGEHGLRARLLDEAGSDLLGRWRRAYAGRVGGEDRLLRSMLGADVNSRSRVVSDSQLESGGVGAIVGFGANALSAYAMFKSLPEVVGGFKMIRDSAPILQSTLLMLLIIALPFLIAMSGYGIERLMMLSFLFVSLIFWGFLFKLIFWMDNTMSAALFPDGWLQQTVSLPFRVVFQMMMFGLYLALPLLFTHWMGEAGRNAGSGLAQMMAGGGERLLMARSALMRASMDKRGRA